MRNTAFDERYQDLERHYLTPLWRAESGIMPSVPQQKVLHGHGSGRNSAGSHPPAANWVRWIGEVIVGPSA
jgi:hypothetical protein